MALIRNHTIENNQGGRGGCLLQSPTTGSIYYVSIERGSIVVRDWGQQERGRDGQTTLAGPHVSACFAYPGMVVVTIVGFDANSSNSRMETWEFPVRED